MAAAVVPAAAIPALTSAAKTLADEGASVARAIIAAMEKPIYSDLQTQTVTHVAKNGDIIVRTTTKGWTIPLGVPVLFIGAIAAWEIGLALANAFKQAGNLVPTVADALNPANWIAYAIAGPGGFLLGSAIQNLISGASGGSAPSSAPQTVNLPPSFMAHLSFLGQQLLTPGTAIGQQVLKKVLGSVPNL